MPQKRNPSAEGEQMEQESPVQIYANAVQFTLGAFDAFLEFALNAPKETIPKPLVRVHMSIEHAWVMAKIMDRIFADFRMKGGKFTIPPEVLNQLGLTDEYREDMGA